MLKYCNFIQDYKSMKINKLLFSGVILFNITATYAQLPIEGKYYKSSRGEPIYMPLGEISFADKVVSFTIGKPAPLEKYTNPEEALGEPNYTHYRVPNYVSLGCGGELVLEFTDNGFIDLDGPDLYIWEVGPSEESFKLEISTNGKEWRSLGLIQGGKSYVDISPVTNAEEKEVFYFVKIIDQKNICTGDTIGCDIDAVGTISGVIKIELNTDVLFDFDRFDIKEDAREEIINLTNQIARVGMAEIVIEGHTDSDGSEAYNELLAQRRADAVLEKIEKILSEKGTYLYKTVAFGETRPIATNETSEGKQLNRRVEIVVLPHRDFYKPQNKSNGKQ